MKIKINVVISILIGCMCISALVTVLLLLSSNYKMYGILSAILLVIFAISTALTYRTTTDPPVTYKNNVKIILKNYDSILVKTNDLPSFIDKQIIITDYIEDLVNAQEEVKKPIFYKLGEKSSSYYLLDNDIVVVFILKMYEDIKDAIEVKIEEDRVRSMYKNVDDSILNDIENTVIVKLKNKSFRVSPIRKKAPEMPGANVELPIKKND